MFVLSMKTTRARMAAVVAVGGLLLAVMIGVSATQDGTATSAVVATDPAAYLQSLGYEVETPWTALQEVVVPTRDDPAFAAVNAVAQTAGYDLTPYAGQRVKRYTYAVRNHPDNRPVEADVYVHQGRILAATLCAEGGDPTLLKPLTKQGENDGKTG